MTRRSNWCGGWSISKFGTPSANIIRLQIGWRMRRWIEAGKGQVKAGFKVSRFQSFQQRAVSVHSDIEYRNLETLKL
jgi:hypothetical protein